MRSRSVLRMPLSASLSFANEQAMDLHASINVRVGGPYFTNLHVLLDVVRDPLRPTDGSEKRNADIASVAVAPEGDSRHAHPERLARGCCASVGKHIKGDVQLTICGQMCAVVRNNA